MQKCGSVVEAFRSSLARSVHRDPTLPGPATSENRHHANLVGCVKMKRERQDWLQNRSPFCNGASDVMHGVLRMRGHGAPAWHDCPRTTFLPVFNVGGRRRRVCQRPVSRRPFHQPQTPCRRRHRIAISDFSPLSFPAGFCCPSPWPANDRTAAQDLRDSTGLDERADVYAWNRA